jgi:hypothetical protein
MKAQSDRDSFARLHTLRLDVSIADGHNAQSDYCVKKNLLRRDASAATMGAARGAQV